MERSFVLLRRRMRPYFSRHDHVDGLKFRNTFWHAARRGQIDVETYERWFACRNRLDTPAHGRFGRHLAESVPRDSAQIRLRR